MPLQLWLPLMDNLDNQGLNDLVTAKVQTGVSQSSDGKLGKCYKNTGTTKSVATAVKFSADTFSLGAWVRIDSRNNNWCRAVGLYGSDGYMGLACEHTNGTGLGFHYYKTIDGTNTSIFDAYPITSDNGVWVHYVMCYDGTKYYIYKNGTLVTSANANRSNIRAEMTTMYLFGGTGSAYSSCSINDVRLYDHALSPKEVKLLSQGLVAHYQLNGDGKGNTNILTNSTGYQGTTDWSGVIAASTENNSSFLVAKRTDTESTSRTFVTHSAITTLVSSWVAGDKFTISGYYKVPSSETYAVTANMFIRWTHKSGESAFTDTGFSTPSNVEKDKWIRFENTYSVPANYQDGSVYFYISAFTRGLSTVYWKNVKLEVGEKATAWVPSIIDRMYKDLGYDETTIYDSSGYNYHGTKSGTLTVDSNTPRYSVSTQFSSGSHINTTLVTGGFTNTYTFAWWGYIVNYTGHMMWGFSNGNRLNLYMANGGNNFYWNTGDGGNNPFGSIKPSDYKNAWHYFTVTGDGTTTKLYIDGEFKANATTYKGITGTTIYFNGWDSGTSYNCNGKLSDFRLYTTCLSADDIKQLYNTPESIANNGSVLTQGEFVEV